MVTPSGCSGVQRVPKAGHSGGFRSPHSTSPAMHSPVVVAAPADRAEPRLGVEGAVGLGEAEPALGDLADAAPAPGHDPEHLGHHLARRRIARPPDGAGVLVLDLGAARLQLPDAEIDALEDVERLEAGDHDRHAVAAGDRLVLVEAHDRADVAGGEEALDAVGRAAEDRGHRRRHEDVRDEQREVGDALALRPERGHGVGRRRGLEADGEEDDLASGIAARDVERVERRVDDADIAAVRPRGEEVGIRARHAQHVAEGAEDRVGPAGDLDRLVDIVDRRDADRAAGAMDQRHLGRQQLVDAVADDGMGLAAADLHDRPRARDHRGDGVGEAPGGGGVAIFVAVLHDGVPAPSSASISPIRSRCSNTLAASASSMTVMAKPTWTRT